MWRQATGGCNGLCQRSVQFGVNHEEDVAECACCRLGDASSMGVKPLPLTLSIHGGQ